MEKRQIGFSVKAISSDNEESLEEIEQMLHGIEADNKSLEEELKREVKSARHLKKNIKMLESLVEEIHQIYDKIEKLITKLFALVAKPSFDTKEAEELIQKISGYNKAIRAKIVLANSEIKNYILGQAHNVYVREKHKAELIEEVDQIARLLQSSLIIIANKIESHQEHVNNVVQKVQLRVQEDKVKPSNKVGY